MESSATPAASPDADYVSVVYNEAKRPRTAYPFQLAAYLCERFDLKPGMKLLDTGCGRGELLEAFSRMGLEVHGLDSSDSAVQALKQYRVKKADLEKDPFPFESDSFDVVFSKSVFEHFYHPEHLLKESIRVLKPKGRLLTLTPDWVSQMPIFYDDYTHRTPFTCESIKDMFEIFGLKDVTSEKFYQLPILWRHPWLKIVSRLLSLFVPVTTKPRIKFVRWSIELMILGVGRK